jgi:DNA-binding ferritin-like protein
MTDKLKFSSLYGGMINGVAQDQNFLESYVIELLQLRTDIKMFHWQTKSFAYHKVSDELLSSIDDLTDKLVETGSGLLNIRPEVSLNVTICINNLSTKSEFASKLRKINNFLKEPSYLMTNTEIANIRDEILGSIDKALYLLSFD